MIYFKNNLKEGKCFILISQNSTITTRLWREKGSSKCCSNVHSLKSNSGTGEIYNQYIYKSEFKVRLSNVIYNKMGLSWHFFRNWPDVRNPSFLIA